MPLRGRYGRNAQRQHVIQDMVITHVAGRQHQIPDFLVLAQAGAVSDHQRQVRAQRGEMIGDRLGVGWPDPMFTMVTPARPGSM